MACDVRLLARRPGNFGVLCLALTLAAFVLFHIGQRRNGHLQSGWSRKAASLSFPGQRQLNSENFNPNNPLGFNGREARLADRVRDMEDENKRLKHQLSISQNQLISVMSDQQKTDLLGQDDAENEDDDGGGGEESHKPPCNHKDPGLPKCEVIHVAIVCAGYNSTRTVVTLVKSILFYRRHPVHFHFVTDTPSKNIMDNLFRTWMLPQVRVSFYLSESVVDDVSWVPNKHYSGIYGLLKLTLPKILPQNLHKVIVLDTDVTLATDISKLWKLFSTLLPAEALGLVENQSDWYIPGKLWKSHSPWPALGRGFNTGVILMNLAKLRAKNWSQLWRLVAEKDLVTMYGTSLADQDIFNALLKQHPNLVHTLPCQWNLQLSDNTRSEICYSSGVQDLNIIHFNSPKKLDVKNKNVEYFRNHYLTFQQYDGNLLRRDLIDCNVSTPYDPRPRSRPAAENGEKAESPEISPDIEDDAMMCYEVKKAREKVFRTHLYYMDFSDGTIERDEVTLVAQLSMDRLHMVESLCAQWVGPISLALYLSDAEADQVVHFVQNSDLLKQRKNVGYHVVYKEGDYYPINFLRNVALDNVETEFVFLSDVDFLPGLDAYGALKKAASYFFSQKPSDNLRALIVPAFETQRYRLDEFPRTKSDVIHLLDEGTLFTFRYHVWTQGHKATNFAKWRSATTPYKVQWEPDFEPYVVMRKQDVVPYDSRFVGFGWNKVSHIMEMAAKDTEFVVLPNVFIIHMPHAPSLDIAKYRASEQYRKCLKLLKQEFVKDMKAKYGRTFRI